jgi:hypothetical protein
MTVHQFPRPRRLERVITSDVRVPFSADDPEMENGWQCISVRPTADDGWFILDASSDRKTVWGRWIEPGDEPPFGGDAA